MLRPIDSPVQPAITPARFERFTIEKTREAEHAALQPLRTTEDHSRARRIRAIGNTWTRHFYDGDFHLLEQPPGRPAVTLVFVQSRDGNTGARNPGTLGGGPVDKHLIYEGL